MAGPPTAIATRPPKISRNDLQCRRARDGEPAPLLWKREIFGWTVSQEEGLSLRSLLGNETVGCEGFPKAATEHESERQRFAHCFMGNVTHECFLAHHLLDICVRWGKPSV